MARGGRAWRGWFPVGAELTSRRPDCKEGIYFGAALGEDDPRVRAGTPLHGPNLSPDLPAFRETVLAWMAATTRLAHTLMRGIALSLELPETWFAERFTGDPLTLFRIFNDPEIPRGAGELPCSVGEHTDYGVLTILLQDDAGWLVGWLQVKAGRGAAGPLDHQAGGSRSPVVSVLLRSQLESRRRADSRLRSHARRWRRALRRRECARSRGSYGDPLLAKVSKVFPELKRAVL